MAGAEGFEPSTKVLETHVLPLHHAPIAFATVALYEKTYHFVKVIFCISYVYFFLSQIKSFYILSIYTFLSEVIICRRINSLIFP